MSTVEFSHQPGNSGDERPASDEHNDWPSELLEPRWSVISFDKCEAAGLTYSDALKTMLDLEKNRISGLCIVTDEAAANLDC